VVAHVRYDEGVLEAAEEAVDVGLAVLVVPHVEHEHERDADEVNGEDVLLVTEGQNFGAILGKESAPGEQEVCEAHVAEGAEEERGEAELVNLESLLR